MFHADRQTGRQAGRQTDRQTDRRKPIVVSCNFANAAKTIFLSVMTMKLSQEKA
jgi:hypothetical protein